ncbi:MAG: mannose-1-phosphate guanylyltransferase [Actinomycetaceae bacterium]|nr:mannose-1-phosphate guanylyltransferase [Actinomycetaceae bacterium]
MSDTQLHAIIPAGGAGTRLWPLSRASHPKFLLPLGRPERSLLQATVERLAPLAHTITIVTGQSHEESVRAQVADYANIRILSEPAGRDSMPAIGIASELIRLEFGSQAIVGSFAADHVIADEQLFRELVHNAVGAAERGYITTLGIEPSHPSTAFGYIKPGATVMEGVRAAQEFVEKPHVERAKVFLANGYLWNAGIFIMQTGALHRELATHQPQLGKLLAELARQWYDLNQEEKTERWSELAAIAFDYAVAEPSARAGHVAVVAAPAQVGWSDLGDFKSLTHHSGGAYELPTPTAVDARSPHAYGTAETPPIFVVGIDDCIIVHTADALLITTAEASQKVKEIPAQLKENGHPDLN